MYIYECVCVCDTHVLAIHRSYICIEKSLSPLWMIWCVPGVCSSDHALHRLRQDEEGPHTADPREEDIFDDERERKGRRDEMDKKKELIETFATKAYDGDDSVFAEDAIVQPPYGTIA